MPLTVKGIIESMPKRFVPHKAAGIEAVFQFDISGQEAGQWYVSIKDQKCEVTQGVHNEPHVTFAMETDDFKDMITDKISGQAAFFAGKLRVSGDLLLAQRMESFFRGT